MIKVKTLLLICFFFAGIGALSAEVKSLNYSNDYGFEQERMIIDRGEIFIISSFDTEDHVTVYTLYGSLLWDASFHAKILSWEVTENYLVVFSKDRHGHTTYLTCIDRLTGKKVWQRP